MELFGRWASNTSVVQPGSSVLLAEDVSGCLPPVTSILRLWMEQGDFQFVLEVLASLREERSLWPAEKDLGEAFFCRRFREGRGKIDDDKMSKSTLARHCGRASRNGLDTKLLAMP